MKLKKVIYKFLLENSDLDISHNKECKRIYNKIKKNIKTIPFEKVPNDSNLEFVKDSKGNKHPIYGVKFNLKYLDEKYDLDLFFIDNIKVKDVHYDKENNRIVFPIISQTDKFSFDHNSSLARVRFESWISFETFLHEFTHFLDSKRYNSSYKFINPENSAEYYNSPEEFNAYTQEIIDSVLKNKNTLKEKSFKHFLNKAYQFGNKNFISNLNLEYKNKLDRRLYKIYDSIKNKLNEKQFVNENVNDKIFLGYHSSRNDMKSGYYKSNVLNVSDYSDVIRSAYMDIISDYDEYLENDDTEGMNNVFKKYGYGFTFVSIEPIKASAYQSSEYKYGDYLYKVYGDGSEILLDDVNEIGATIVASKKPLFFEKI